MNSYLAMQIEAGADVVQLFDSWAGVLDRDSYRNLAMPPATRALAHLDALRIYFAPGCGHTLDLQPSIGAEGYAVDWRLPLDEAWARLGDAAIQGNVDPAVLLADPDTIRKAASDLLARSAGRNGHIVNLGHGIDRHTPPENVAAFVEAVRT
jgi:uroporphyrinogen decarboxylase